MKYVKYDNSQGDQCWSKDGLLHREDGPAVELANGRREWFINGDRHREDGPAVVEADGQCSWYWRNMLVEAKSQEEFEMEVRILKIQEVQES